MTASISLRALTTGFAIAVLAGCSGGSQIAPSTALPQSAAQSLHQAKTQAHGFAGLFANPKLNALIASRPAPGSPGTFGKGSPDSTKALLIASSASGGDIDVYDAANGAHLTNCSACGGGGAAVNAKSGDLAVGTESATVSVYHRTNYFTQFATLVMSNGSQPVGLAYDSKGGLYAADLTTNRIDYFSATKIAQGGGTADSSIYVPEFTNAFYLATDGTTLIADGVQPSTNDMITVEIKQTKHTTTFTILQQLAAGAGYPGGVMVDKQHNLTINNQYGTTSTYAPPWTGAPLRSLDWYDDGYSNYMAIALSKNEKTMYTTNLIDVSNGYTDVVYGTYNPLGEFGSTQSISNEVYVGVAADPAD